MEIAMFPNNPDDIHVEQTTPHEPRTADPTYSLSSPTIFISYSRADATFARDLHDKLQALGFKLWRDRNDMAAGEDWWQQIQKAIRTADTMVLVLSPAAIASTEVAKEWRYARQEGTRVIPV